MLAATGPLLQSWFARTSHAGAADPYPLYAASNLGSLLALLGYPLLIEPRLSLSSQRGAWSWACAGFAVLVIGCGLVAIVRPESAPTRAAARPEPAHDPHPAAWLISRSSRPA